MTTAIVDQMSQTKARPPSVRQPARRPATDRGPLARPARPAPIPPHSSVGFVPVGSRGKVSPSSTARACRADPVTRPSAPWPLTDRGIALVLVLTAMIVLAAVTVIGLTAWRVTGPGYQATGVAELSRR